MVMTDTQLTIILAAIPPILIALGAIYVAVKNANKAVEAVKEAKESVQEIKVSIDGRMDELLTLTRKASHAEGMKDEKESAK